MIPFYLAFSNFIFYGIFGILMWIENSDTYIQYSTFAFILPPAIILFLVIYGIYSFKVSKKIIYPHIILYIFSAFFNLFMMRLYTPINSNILIIILARLLIAFLLTLISITFALITKTIIHKKK